MRRDILQRLCHRPILSVKRRGRQPKQHSLFSPTLARRYWPRDNIITPALKTTTPRTDTLSRHVDSCRIAAGFLKHWPISHAGEVNGTVVSLISTKPSVSTHAMSTFSPSTRFYISHFVVSPKRCENLIRFSILHRTTLILSRKRQLSHKPKATCPEPQRCSLRCDPRPPTRAFSEHKFSKQSSSTALRKSSLGQRKYWPRRIPHRVIPLEGCAFGWAGRRKWRATMPPPKKAGGERVMKWNFFSKTNRKMLY